MTLRISTGLRNELLGINTNLVTNGDFTTDTDPPPSWTATAATLTTEGSGQSGNCLRVTETGSSLAGKAYQDIATKVGHLYKLTLYFKKGTADYGKFTVGTTGADSGIYDSGNLNDATWTQKTCYFVATATTTRIVMVTVDATAGEYSDFDTIVLEHESKSLQDIFNGAEIKFYTGTQPASADDAPSGTLLVTVKNGGSGVTFDDAAAGVLTKASTETWSGVAVATGTAGWARLQTAADSLLSSTTDERIDMAVSTSGAQINMSSTAFTLGATQTLTAFSITCPAS